MFNYICLRQIYNACLFLNHETILLLLNMYCFILIKDLLKELKLLDSYENYCTFKVIVLKILTQMEFDLINYLLQKTVVKRERIMCL